MAAKVRGKKKEIKKDYRTNKKNDKILYINKIQTNIFYRRYTLQDN